MSLFLHNLSRYFSKIKTANLQVKIRKIFNLARQHGGMLMCCNKTFVSSEIDEGEIDLRGYKAKSRAFWVHPANRSLKLYFLFCYYY